MHTDFHEVETHVYFTMNSVKDKAFHPSLPTSLKKPLPSITELWRDTDSKTRCSLHQKELSIVAQHCSDWLATLHRPRGTYLRRGEPQRHCSQPRGSTHHLHLPTQLQLEATGVTNECNIRYSRVRLPIFRAALQYRMWACMSLGPHIYPRREAEKRKEQVTQANRLGDNPAPTSSSRTTRPLVQVTLLLTMSSTHSTDRGSAC